MVVGGYVCLLNLFIHLFLYFSINYYYLNIVGDILTFIENYMNIFNFVLFFLGTSGLKAEAKVRGKDIKRRRIFMRDSAADLELLIEPLYGKGKKGTHAVAEQHAECGGVGHEVRREHHPEREGCPSDVRAPGQFHSNPDVCDLVHRADALEAELEQGHR